MTSAFLVQLDRAARNMTPAVLSLMVVMVGALPLQLPYFGLVAPNLAIMSAFYWSVYRPDLFTAWVAFLIGLWQDVLIGTPPGLNACVLVVAHMVLSSQRRFFQGASFLVVWWAFAIVAAGAGTMQWLLFMALHVTVIDPEPAFFQFGLTLALFPFVTWLFARVHHSVLRQT